MGLDVISQLKEFLANNNSVTVIQNTILFLILYGLKELLEKQIPCPCVVGMNLIFAWMFFLFPSVILLMISLLLQFESDQYYWCCRCGGTAKKRTAGQVEQEGEVPEEVPEKGHHCDILPVMSLFKILTPSVLWISILFLDGDYYSCAEIMKDEKVTNKTCSEFNCKGDPIHFISGLQRHCDKSRFIGGNLIFMYLVVLLLFYFLHSCTTCKMRKACKNKSNSRHGKKDTGKQNRSRESQSKDADETTEEQRPSSEAGGPSVSEQRNSQQLSDKRMTSEGSQNDCNEEGAARNYDRETSTHEKDELLSGEEGTEQQTSSQEITHKVQVPLSVDVMVHQKPSDEETKV